MTHGYESLGDSQTMATQSQQNTHNHNFVPSKSTRNLHVGRKERNREIKGKEERKKGKEKKREKERKRSEYTIKNNGNRIWKAYIIKFPK